MAELVAAERLAEQFGLEGSESLLGLFGFREIGAGAGILMARKTSPWLWARVGGDVLDLLALSSGLKPSNPKRGRLAIATAAVAGITALDILCGWRLCQRGD